MTTIFDGYDEEYRALTSSISSKISEVATYENDKEKRRNTINHTGDLITQASQLIQQMELEVRSLDAATRRELSKKVTQYKSSLASLQEDYKKLGEKEDRNGLFDRDDIAMSSANQRDRMTASSEKLKGSTDRIAAARRTIADTEETALGIVEELGRNREKIEATHAKVKNVNDMAREGGTILGRMSTRDRQQKLFLYAAMLLIVLAIVLILYYAIFK